MHLNWELTCKQINEWSSSFSGSLLSDGLITGNLTAPAIRNNLIFTNLKYNQKNIGRLELKNNLKLQLSDHLLIHLPLNS